MSGRLAFRGKCANLYGNSRGCPSVFRVRNVGHRRAGVFRSINRRLRAAESPDPVVNGNDTDTGKEEEEVEEPVARSATDEDVMREVCDKIFPQDGVDWENFWKNDDLEDWNEQWVEALKESGVEVEGKTPTLEDQAAWADKAVDYLSKRTDFMKHLPPDWAKTFLDIEDSPSEKLIMDDMYELNPDWDAVSLRAMMEKRRAREASRAAWRQRKSEVGRFEYFDVLAVDPRIEDELRKEFSCSDEEAWQLIRQDGHAVHPNEVEGKSITVKDPEEMPDYADLRIKYIESTEEYLRRAGKMVDNAQSVMDREITLMGKDFEDFEKTVGQPPQGTILKGSPEEGIEEVIE